MMKSSILIVAVVCATLATAAPGMSSGENEMDRQGPQLGGREQQGQNGFNPSGLSNGFGPRGGNQREDKFGGQNGYQQGGHQQHGYQQEGRQQNGFHPENRHGPGQSGGMFGGHQQGGIGGMFERLNPFRARGQQASGQNGFQNHDFNEFF